MILVLQSDNKTIDSFQKLNLVAMAVDQPTGEGRIRRREDDDPHASIINAHLSALSSFVKTVN